MINGIVCCAKDFGIGKQNGLLFDIPADMKHFVDKTKGKIVVMGKSTYDSLPKKPLKNRLNLIIWDKAPSIDCLEGCLTFNNFEQLLKAVKLLAERDEVFICGGASVYKLFLPYYDRLYITMVDAIDPEATAFFPNINEHPEFKLVNAYFEEYEPYQLSFLTYVRG